MYIPYDTVHRIHQHSRGLYRSWADIDRRADKLTWHETFTPASPGTGGVVQPHGVDLYFSALVFTEQRRSNDTVGGAGVLFADLDEAPQPEILPSIYWETSPGRYQAVWLLTKPIYDYERWASVNRAMTVYTGADPGGWAGAKMLRMPGSYNFKRNEAGMLLWDRMYQYDFEDLEKELTPYVERSSLEETPHPNVPSDRKSAGAVVKAWDKLSLRGRSMLVQNPTDRSLHIVKTIRELLYCGVSKQDVFEILWCRPWNKWRTDLYKPEQLWYEICKIADE